MKTIKEMRAIVLLLFVLILTGCGGGGNSGASGNPQGSGGGGNVTPPARHTISWLQQGTTWKYQWSVADMNQSWTDLAGTFDEGFFLVTLGAEQVSGDLYIYPIIKSGNDGGFLGKWIYLGADSANNIYGLQTLSSAPALLFSSSGANPANGYFGNYTSQISVYPNRNPATQSFYAGDYPVYNEALAAIGSSATNVDFSSGGCEYFSGYGTICTEASSGPITGLTEFQYWSSTSGPSVMHFYKSYEDCLGFACTVRKTEKRIDLFSFGSADSIPDNFALELEPNNYSTPTPLNVNKALNVMVSNISNADPVSGYITGYSAPAGMDLAASMRDWYEFEVLPGQGNVTFDFYLVWNDPDATLDFFLYTAPGNTTYGFLYLAEAASFSMSEFNNSKFFSGTLLPGKYLLGVKETSTLAKPVGYGIISARSDLLPP